MAVETEVLLGDRNPMNAIASSWETRSTGFKMPITVNGWPPIDTWVGLARLLIPSSLAVSAPSTTAGYLAVAAFKKVPWATVAPTVAGREASVALREMPLVSIVGMNELR